MEAYSLAGSQPCRSRFAGFAVLPVIFVVFLLCFAAFAVFAGFLGWIDGLLYEHFIIISVGKDEMGDRDQPICIYGIYNGDKRNYHTYL